MVTTLPTPLPLPLQLLFQFVEEAPIRALLDDFLGAAPDEAHLIDLLYVSA
jgi:hypothetical protein